MSEEMQPHRSLTARAAAGDRFRLAIVHLVCPEYKVPMFEAIARLPGVRLTLFVGDIAPTSHPPGAARIPVDHVWVQNRIFRLFGLEAVWQVLGRLLRPANYDLVLLPDGLLYLANYLTMLRCWWRNVPFGLYTHGYNHQRKVGRVWAILERWRGFLQRRCDVLVVYSPDGARHVVEVSGVAPERVFVARNTLDVEGIQASARSWIGLRTDTVREQLGVAAHDVLLVYAGRLAPIKRPHWVIDAVAQLRADGLPVRAVFVGDGECLPELRRRLAQLPEGTRDAIRLVGRVPVEEVSRYVLAGDITVMPGMTGLAVVHSFALGRPYVTVASGTHSPEVCYLSHGVNGLMAPDTLQGFVAAVRYLATYPEVRRAMGEAALSLATKELTLAQQLRGFEKVIAFIRPPWAPRGSPGGAALA